MANKSLGYFVDQYGAPLLRAGVVLDTVTDAPSIVSPKRDGSVQTTGLGGGGGGSNTYVGLSDAATVDLTTVNTPLSTALAAKIAASLIGVANGVAGLDSGGKVPTAQLPAAILGALNYQSTWNASTNSPALASGTGTKGFYYTVATAGATTLDGISQWNVGDHAVYNGSAWEKIDGIASEVISVAGRTGVVTLAVADVTGAAPATNPTFTGGTVDTYSLGYKESPVNPQSAAYTTVASDSGWTIYHPTTDATARIWTIAANASVPYKVGTMISFDNDAGAGAITIAIGGTDTLVLVGAAGSTGSRTLASGGSAVARKVTATRWRISGSAELT